MLEHDHIRAARSSIYKELRVRMYETAGYIRVVVDCKPLNQCYCTFETIASRRVSKETLDGLPATIGEAMTYTGSVLFDLGAELYRPTE